MRLSRHSKFVRWCWLISDVGVPYRNSSICELFWRGFVFTPLKFAFLLMLLAGACTLLFLALSNGMGRWVIGGFVSVVMFPIWAIMLKRRALGTPDTSVVFAVAKGRIVAVKSKVCPIVELY